MENENKSLSNCAEGLRDVAKKALELLQVVYDDRYAKPLIAFKPEVVIQGEPLYEALADLFGHLGFDLRSTYEFTYDFIYRIVSAKPDTDFSQIKSLTREWAEEDADFESLPELLEWINRSEGYKCYLDEAIWEEETADRYSLLMTAQFKQRMEVYVHVLDILMRTVKECLDRDTPN